MKNRIALGIFLFAVFTLAILLCLPRNSSYKMITKEEHDKIVKLLKEDRDINRDLRIRLKCKISGYEHRRIIETNH